MVKFSNPRSEAVIENWPSGAKRVTAVFKVETNKRGQRASRTTTGKPKFTNYYEKVVIVDCIDGRTYLLAKPHICDFLYVLSSDMQHTIKTVHAEQVEAHAALSELLKAA